MPSEDLVSVNLQKLKHQQATSTSKSPSHLIISEARMLQIFEKINQACSNRQLDKLTKIFTLVEPYSFTDTQRSLFKFDLFSLDTRVIEKLETFLNASTTPQSLTDATLTLTPASSTSTSSTSPLSSVSSTVKSNKSVVSPLDTASHAPNSAAKKSSLSIASSSSVSKSSFSNLNKAANDSKVAIATNAK